VRAAQIVLERAWGSVERADAHSMIVSPGDESRPQTIQVRFVEPRHIDDDDEPSPLH